MLFVVLQFEPRDMPMPYDNSFRDVPVLITGGAGFIGSHLAHRLLELGAVVRVIDDLSGGKRDNLSSGVAFLQESILNPAALDEMMTGCRFVFHQAAMVSVPESVEDPQRCAEVNILGTSMVLDAAGKAGVKRVMFAASAAAYGGEPQLPSREDHPPQCWSPYAASKVAGEMLMQAFARCYPISTVSLRYFNIFGPRQNPDSPYAAVISAFMKAIQAGKQPTIYGDGTQTRDFTYIDNVVHANLLAATTNENMKGQIINIGTGHRISLMDVLANMSRALGKEIKPVFATPRAGDVRDSVADLGTAQKLLGYKPIVDFPTGIARTLAAEGVIPASTQVAHD
jgi:UDP-glucose 4-epimerase